jgi:hypothetical protein
MYNSILNQEKSQYLFVQNYPKYHCKRLAYRQAIQERLGLEYLPKCRDPRCTHGCQTNWASKMSTVRARRLHDLPDDFYQIRGNLTMPDGASRSDHAKVRERFCQALRRWKKRNGVAIELHAITHADPRQAHYDFVGYVSRPPKAAMCAIRELWVRSGGLRATVCPLKSEDVEPVVNYQSHPAAPNPSNKRIQLRRRSDPQINTPNDTNNVINREQVYLLKPRSEGGLKSHWQTGGFWGDTNAEAIWEQLKLEWFGDAEDQQERAFAAARLRAEHGIPEPAPAKTNPAPQPYIPGEDMKSDVLHFARCLPSEPGSAVGISDYATQWDVSTAYMLSCLRKNSKAKCLNGWRNEQGYAVFNAWYHDAT